MISALAAAAWLTPPLPAAAGDAAGPSQPVGAVQAQERSLQQREGERPRRQVHCQVCNSWYVPPMAISPDGGFYTLWVDRGVGSNDETLYLRKMKPDATDAWTKFIPIYGARRREGVPFALRDPEIIPDGFGGVIVAWSAAEQNDFNVYAQRIDDSGAFYWDKPARIVCSARADQVHARLMVDRWGGAFVGWQDFRGGNWDVYVQHVAPSGKLDWEEAGQQVTFQSRNEYLTTIAPDGLGGIWLTWWDERTGRSDLFSAHLDSLGKLTTPKPYLWRQYE